MSSKPPWPITGTGSTQPTRPKVGAKRGAGWLAALTTAVLAGIAVAGCGAAHKSLTTGQSAGPVIRQQQPYTTKLAAHANPGRAVRAAVTAYMTNQVNHDKITGPYQSNSCHHAGGTSHRMRYHCTVIAAKLTYPFDAVVQPASAEITYCQVVTPPIPSMRVPVTHRCT